MSTKTVAEYLDKTLGFPVILEKVQLIEVRGEWAPKINYKAYSIAVLHSLAKTDSRLTGNQVRFIRLYLEKTLEEFAKRLHVTHPAVLKWEKRGDKATDMSWSTEKDIRLFIAKSLNKSSSNFLKLYDFLEEIKKTSPAQIIVQADKLVA